MKDEVQESLTVVIDQYNKLLDEKSEQIRILRSRIFELERKLNKK